VQHSHLALALLEYAGKLTYFIFSGRTDSHYIIIILRCNGALLWGCRTPSRVAAAERSTALAGSFFVFGFGGMVRVAGVGLWAAHLSVRSRGAGLFLARCGKAW
jgi:hypothetical protein